MPYVLVYVGTPELVVESPVPLCARDHDLDGERTIIPRACPRFVDRPGPARGYATRLHLGQNGVGRSAALVRVPQRLEIGWCTSGIEATPACVLSTQRP